MSPGKDRLMKNLQKFADAQFKHFTALYGQQLIDMAEFPIKLILSPFTLAFDIAGSAQRGFGIPEFISKLSCASVFVVAAMGTYDIAFEMGRKVLCQRDCKTCNGWEALRCTMCKGTGRVHYQVKSYALKSGEKPTAESIADAIANNRAQLVHLPASVDLHTPLPSKDCPICEGTGVMHCPECKHKFQLRISADDIMEPPWKAYNVLRKMDYPYENIIRSMKDPSIAAFWLFTLPQIVGAFEYDDEVKQKIWWQYNESMKYDQIRDMVAKRDPGWEYLQDALISLDPARARDDPVIVRNIPYYKAKKVLEAEVLKLDPPPRPPNWGELDLPLNVSSWSEDDLRDPEKVNEMKVLLNAQRDIADKILDAQWETKWRQEKLNEMWEEKLQPYFKEIGSSVLPRSIVLHQKQKRKKRWWFF